MALNIFFSGFGHCKLLFIFFYFFEWIVKCHQWSPSIQHKVYMCTLVRSIYVESSCTRTRHSASLNNKRCFYLMYYFDIIYIIKHIDNISMRFFYCLFHIYNISLLLLLLLILGNYFWSQFRFFFFCAPKWICR